MPPAQWKLRAADVPAQIAIARRARPVAIFFTSSSPFSGTRLGARPAHDRSTARGVPAETGDGRRPHSPRPYAGPRLLTGLFARGCQARPGVKRLSRAV